MQKGLYMESYGCQMNMYDSLMIQDVLRPLGFALVSDLKDADIVVINTCHIREKASEKLYSALGRVRMLRKKDCLVVVAGCVAQAEGEAVFEKAPVVDVVVGPQSIHTLPELVMKARRDKRQINVEFPVISKFDMLPAKRDANGGVSAFVSIQEGCDKFCTFCVVPYTRGPEYSRPVEDVMQEVRELADKGAKEIILLGQNVSAYHGTHKGTEVDLGYLIQQVAKVATVERIRYITSHPKDMHDSLYDAHRYEPKLMPLIHLPVQSGSNSVLRRMNRKYTAEDYLSIADKLRDARSDMALSSDFIVGFPGETDKDFEDTMELVRNVGFTQSYSFKYSPRPGTPGAEYPDRIEEKVAKERLSRLQSLLSEQQLSFNQNMVGQVIKILVCGTENKRNGDGKMLFGKSEYMQSVKVPIDSDVEAYLDRVLSVKVSEGRKNSLLATICAESVGEEKVHSAKYPHSDCRVHT
ncbi:MAG: tRNA (N6-isopentenyl adenosine(37)-C2)-methylthiotransferase MiaB [Anaplasma sp.]